MVIRLTVSNFTKHHLFPVNTKQELNHRAVIFGVLLGSCGRQTEGSVSCSLCYSLMCRISLYACFVLLPPAVGWFPARSFAQSDLEKFMEEKALELSKNENNLGLPIPTEDYIDLKVEIMQGDFFCGYISSTGDKSFICNVAFLNQRYISEPIKASGRPDFDHETTFIINKEIGLRELLMENPPMHFALIEQNHKTKKRILIGTRKIEWRHILYSKSIEQEIEFVSMELNNKNPVGIVKVS